MHVLYKPASGDSSTQKWQPEIPEEIEDSSKHRPIKVTGNAEISGLTDTIRVIGVRRLWHIQRIYSFKGNRRFQETVEDSSSHRPIKVTGNAEILGLVDTI